MAFKIADRGRIDPFIVMDVMRRAQRRAAEGGDVLHLEVGQPSGAAPAAVVAAARQALDEDPLGYTLALGLDPLRERIARHYAETYGVSVGAERIAVTTGSSGAFLVAFLAAFAAGDRVAVAAPGYPAYRNILKALDITYVPIAVGPESRWCLTARHLEPLAGQLDGVVVASPANPTGAMMSGNDMAELSDWCEANGVRLVSDEIYHGITFGAAASTAAGRGPHAIVVNSFSKYFAMTGWRLGWMVVPPDLARAVECLQQNLFISPPTLSQLAAVAAFDCRDDLDERVARYAANRAILCDGLPQAGFTRLAPSDGAFYLYADISEMTGDSQDFCARMLAETGIAATPGIDFDPERGSGFMRFSFAGATADMIEAVRRLTAWRK
jgi:aspartate/methionine/tyrosine aminotransferase